MEGGSKSHNDKSKNKEKGILSLRVLKYEGSKIWLEGARKMNQVRVRAIRFFPPHNRPFRSPPLPVNSYCESKISLDSGVDSLQFRSWRFVSQVFRCSSFSQKSSKYAFLTPNTQSNGMRISNVVRNSICAQSRRKRREKNGEFTPQERRTEGLRFAIGSRPKPGKSRKHRTHVQAMGLSLIAGQKSVTMGATGHAKKNPGDGRAPGEMGLQDREGVSGFAISTKSDRSLRVRGGRGRAECTSCRCRCRCIGTSPRIRSAYDRKGCKCRRRAR